MLAANDLAHGAVRVAATPRRLIVRVEDLAPASTESEKVERGPHEAAAFDAHGKPTPALAGMGAQDGRAGRVAQPRSAKRDRRQEIRDVHRRVGGARPPRS